MKKTWIILMVALSTMAVTIPAFASHKGYTHDEVRTPVTTEAAVPVAVVSEYTLDEIRAPITTGDTSKVVVFSSHQNMEMTEAHNAK